MKLVTQIVTQAPRGFPSSAGQRPEKLRISGDERVQRNTRKTMADAFQDRCLQPLGHPSIVVNQGLHATADKYKSGNGHGMVTALGVP